MRRREWLSRVELLSNQSYTTAGVSVIIPCYQAGSTVGRALASVAAQSVKPFEVIIVDDASTDATRNRLQELVEKYKPDWLKVYFLTENCGPASARNYGWELATQPFVAFLDADDSWHRDKIALQLAFMRQNSEISFCGHSCGEISSLIRKLPKKFQVTNCTLKELLFRNRLQTTSTVMLKRDLVVRFPKTSRYSEDYYLW
ncbi:MAG: glycosyltransferase family 2 protein, partial [Deltaproteobacteria bacterium]|nr:glycosyltransferase family 2 protein [Deltaproteobacteria bacterium]